MKGFGVEQSIWDKEDEKHNIVFEETKSNNILIYYVNSLHPTNVRYSEHFESKNFVDFVLQKIKRKIFADRLLQNNVCKVNVVVSYNMRKILVTGDFIGNINNFSTKTYKVTLPDITKVFNEIENSIYHKVGIDGDDLGGSEWSFNKFINIKVNCYVTNSNVYDFFVGGKTTKR